MNLYRLALHNIRGSAFRSGVVLLCALLVAGFTLATTLLIRGTERSMRLALGRLGADIVVVPMGSEAQAQDALLMGVTTRIWMPEANLAKIAAIAGVKVATPQLYLSTMSDAPCCSVSDMFLIAFDPATDFTVQPWLMQHIGSGLGEREVVGGTYISTPKGQEFIYMYGYTVTLRTNLEPTGTGLDQTMFITFDTARDMAAHSRTLAIQPLEIPEGKISAVFVQVAPEFDPQEVALNIIHNVPGVTPIKSPDLFQSYRRQMNGMLKGVLAVLGIVWALSVVFIGLVFSMAANERRRELGVLRAMGATRRFVFTSLVSEASMLALAGGLGGVTLTLAVVVLFRQLLVKTMGLPFILPDLPSLALEISIGLAITLVSVALAAFLPAYRISHQDPAVAMRE